MASLTLNRIKTRGGGANNPFKTIWKQSDLSFEAMLNQLRNKFPLNSYSVEQDIIMKRRGEGVHTICRPQEVIIFHLPIRCLTSLETGYFRCRIIGKRLYSRSNPCQKRDKVFWLPKYLPPSRLAPTGLQESIVITRVTQAEPVHRGHSHLKLKFWQLS